MRKKSRKILNESMLEVVENQLRANNPLETKETLKRLLNEGIDEQEAKQLIASVVAAEVYEVMKANQPFDPVRFVNALNKLPKLPE
jgi:hypothetical protein